MRIVGFPEVAKHFDAVVDQVVADREPALVTRRGQEAVVLIAASDWEIVQRRLRFMPDESTP